MIELRFFAGLSALETAVAMGRQEGTVRGLQFRAIAALRRSLGIHPNTPAPEIAAAATPAHSMVTVPLRVRS